MHMGASGRKIEFCTGFLLAVWLLAAFWGPCVSAEEKNGTVLRVAFPQVEGYTLTDEDGERYGLVVDYLNEIAKYTGWKYEYIDTDNNSVVDNFLEGKFDLMGGTYYSEEFENYFAYPEYNSGYSHLVLLARKEDRSIRNYDLGTLQGKTIGIYENSQESIRRLKEWLEYQELDCELKYYDYEDLQKTGSLYRFLEDGEVDLLVGSNAGKSSDFYVAAEFESQAHYIVAQPGNRKILEELNMALGKIYESDPNFAAKVYEKNFQGLDTGYAGLNHEELDYIKKKGTVTVAVPSDWHPMYCLDNTDYHDGFVPDMLKKVAEFSGLKFTYYTCDTYIDAINMLNQEQADMLGFFAGNDKEAARYGLACTEAYASVASILVRNKNITFPNEELIGGVLEGRDLPDNISAKEVKYYRNATDALAAVNRGEIDFFYGLAAHVENIIRQQNFTNVVQVSLDNDNIDVGFATSSPINSELFSILNKAVNNLTEEEKEAISSLNLISVGETEFSLSSLLYANPVMAITLVALFTLFFLVALLLIFRSRLHSAKMKLELEKAEAGSRAKSDFLSRMSHEIRTPMNAIVGLADLTEMIPSLPEKAQINLTKIKTSSRYLLSLINDILDMSRIESGKMELEQNPFSLNVLLCDIESMLTAEAERRELTFRVEKNLQDDVFIGDTVRLRQVILNLLSNAFKFTPSGGTVWLRVTEPSFTETTGNILVQVIDTGIGISEENQKRIFRSFEQVGPNATKCQGTGLGLAISRNIIKLMGGEILVKSELGKGSEFSFSISMLKGELHELPETKTNAKEISFTGVTILLAEDNDLNAEIAIELLQTQGAEVYRAENGKQALELFRDSPEGTFQVILMDIMMPEMNGLEAASSIRALKHPDAERIPIIAMTANTFKEDVESALNAGMTGFVSKPIDVAYLYQELNSVLSNSKRD